jgi:hypothetical protein
MGRLSGGMRPGCRQGERNRMKKTKTETKAKTGVMKTPWPGHPRVFEIHTWPWLHDLSERLGGPVTLGSVPAEALHQPINAFGAVWLMGVWERSPGARELALQDPALLAEFRSVLPDFTPDDVAGSPYAVYSYRVARHLGGKRGLTAFRKQLASRGIRLMLDFVPNHVAVDHPWTREKPGALVQGGEQDLRDHPEAFFATGGRVFAHGRDPNFLPWTDTVQVNAFSREARQQAILTLLDIAECCDGVRCDMAMLMTNGVFYRTWGDRGGPPPEREFWREVIPAVLEKFPHFLFVAEVYWDLEWELQQQGFDYCYDKRLYDRLRYGDADAVRQHLGAPWDYQCRLLRYIENHDEARAVAAFGEGRSRAAAMLALTLPGARFVHEGQMQGRAIHLPVHLGRRPAEPDNPDLLAFYRRLLSAAPAGELTRGRWALCRVEPAGGGNPTFTSLIAHQWWTPAERRLTVVNFSPAPAQGHVRIGGLDYGSGRWTFEDRLTEKSYTYAGGDLHTYGLYIDLPAWGGHIFDVRPEER